MEQQYLMACFRNSTQHNLSTDDQEVRDTTRSLQDAPCVFHGLTACRLSRVINLELHTPLVQLYYNERKIMRRTTQLLPYRGIAECRDNFPATRVR